VSVRVLFLARALVEPSRERAPRVHAVSLQEATALLLGTDGQVDMVPTRLPAGYWYSVAGHERLTLAFAQVQADKLTAEARAEALQQALTLHSQSVARHGYA
jgi:hypothetical protein